MEEFAVAPAKPALQQKKLVIVLHDLAGFARAAERASDLELAAFLDEYYRLCHALVSAAAGRIVKFMGDACLAVFAAEHVVEAVDCAERMRHESEELAKRRRVAVGAGYANVHLESVIEGEIGPDSDRRYDVFGKGVNHTFMLGRGHGPGLHVSEPVYRQLPNDRRSRWIKRRPPAVYTRC